MTYLCQLNLKCCKYVNALNGKGDKQMKNYNLDEYDFNDDENFQKFFRRHLSDENIERDKFIRKLNYCKRAQL